MNTNTQAQHLVGYRGAATLLWGSWRIAGLASIDALAPVHARGTFTVDSEAEPLLLSALASALHEPYTLRLGTEMEQDIPIHIAIVGRNGKRLDFAVQD